MVNHVDKFLRVCGLMTLEEVTPQDILLFMERMSEKGCKNTTINRYMGPVRKALKKTGKTMWMGRPLKCRPPEPKYVMTDKDWKTCDLILNTFPIAGQRCFALWRAGRIKEAEGIAMQNAYRWVKRILASAGVTRPLREIELSPEPIEQ